MVQRTGFAHEIRLDCTSGMIIEVSPGNNGPKIFPLLDQHTHWHPDSLVQQLHGKHEGHHGKQVQARRKVRVARRSEYSGGQPQTKLLQRMPKRRHHYRRGANAPKLLSVDSETS